MAHTVEERFWGKVDRRDEDGCWLWTGYRHPQGYGKFRLDGRPHNAHRVAYELSVGPVQEGLELDHLCRNRACVRPDHLEPVTHRENMQRSAAQRTHCPQGHPWSEANTYTGRGYRECRACNREKMRAARKRTMRATMTP